MQQVREQLPSDEQIELSEFERKGSTYTRAHREGVQEGLERMRAAVLAILERRELAIDAQTAQCIAACSDLDQLSDLLVRAATISTTDELFSTH